ncbi:YabP/YqfC family sporulation protein [Caldicellulosiruptor naganoensis]|uniref:Sporulation protein n=1 Tax=Caldicellulosiruptor naganoensis TaxID=29324 RepID=A0ABY7BI27_9FIRM|nr:YabP/YqfC family sporulation protein [Caldicellulosiruptor naganoensis]WAM30691.1 sporulation protein [Caldicellulosiruptor naganoensis]
MKKHKVLKEMIQVSQLPIEAITNEPRITVVGEDEVVVENHKGLIMYEENVVKLSTIKRPLYIKGNKLIIKKVNEEVIVIG